MADPVFTKMTPNGKITLYMSQREFVDYLSWTEPIDGAIVVERDYIHSDRSIAVQLMSVLRYGREEDEVMGLNLSKEICLANVIVNKAESQLDHLTPMQEHLGRIHGDACFPFHFEWPKLVGPSMVIQQPSNFVGEPCGIKHFIEVFCLYRGAFQPHKRSSVQFEVDLIQMHGTAEKSALWIPPAISISRPLLFALGRVDMEVCLEKTSVSDGEPLVINVSITNHSSKHIREMKVMLNQFYKLSFFDGRPRKRLVDSTTTTTGFPIAPGSTMNQTVILVPRVPLGSEREDLAVRKSSSSHIVKLAPSTLFAETGRTDILGFIISYRVRVKLYVAQLPLKAVVSADVPVFVVAKRKNDCFTHQLPIYEKCTNNSSITFRNRSAPFSK